MIALLGDHRVQQGGHVTIVRGSQVPGNSSVPA
jgi:hypothetical protein